MINKDIIEKLDCVHFPILVNKFYKKMHKMQTQILADYGLSSIHMAYMMSLLEAKDGLTMTELTDIICVDRANTTRVINALEKKGYIYRDIKERCIRKYKIMLTDEGNSIANYARGQANELRNSIISILTESEQECLIEIIKKISANISD